MPLGRLTHGVTLDQVDAIAGLVRTITAHGDVIAVGSVGPLDGDSLPALGEAIYAAGRAARGILDRIETQRLGDGGVVPVAAPRVQGDAGERVRERLLRAHGVAQRLDAAADCGQAGCAASADCRELLALLDDAIATLEAGTVAGEGARGQR